MTLTGVIARLRSIRFLRATGESYSACNQRDFGMTSLICRSGSSIEYSILTACQNATFYVVPPPAGVSETWALEVEVDHGTSTTLHDVPNLEQNNNYVTDVSTAATNSPATLVGFC